MVFDSNERKPKGSRPTEDIPCLKEKSQSLKCLADNNYDYSKCDPAFENFKFCQSFWNKVRSYRKYYGVEPAMPSLEERKEIFQLFKTTGRIPDYSKEKR